MIYQIEYNYEHIPHLYSVFGEDANILCCDYLKTRDIGKFDFIIGNPPFNVGGKIKTPCLKNFNKKKDGKRAWDLFVRKSVKYLNDKGFLLFITPVLPSFIPFKTMMMMIYFFIEENIYSIEHQYKKL